MTCGSWGRHLPNIHVLHAHDHVVVFVQEGTVECDDVIRMAPMHNLELTHDTSSQFLLGLNVYDLNPAILASVYSSSERAKSRSNAARVTLRREKTYLPGHGGTRGQVLDFAHGSSISGPQLLHDLNVFRLKVEIELYSDLELRLLSGLFGSRTASTPAGFLIAVITVGRRLGGGRSKSEALDILALHRARGE